MTTEDAESPAGDGLLEARRWVAAGREAERGRLARELHDGPVQDLIALSYQLAHMAATVPQEATQVARMRTQLLAVVSRLRSLIGELRPPGLSELGLEAALHGLVLRLRTEGPLPPVELDLCDCSSLPDPTAVFLFQATQEALQNVSKHAAAQSVRVQLRRLPQDRVLLTVRDDGRGFAVPERLQDLARTLQFGLVGLAERTELAGGSLQVLSQPGAGTELLLTLPLLDGPDA